MDNLSFEELKALADSVAEKSLLDQISGGTANDCHDELDYSAPRDNTGIGSGYGNGGVT